MAKVTLTDITTSYSQQQALQNNFDALAAAIENTLSRDGSTPNSMEADLDLNSNKLLNVGELEVDSLVVGGENLVATTRVPDWEGSWTTSTSYALDDLVRENGSTYICIEAHTSGVFATDLAASKWELFASAGTSGSGSGDLLAANDLSDLNDADTALANLGGGTTGINLFKDTTAGSARTELGLGGLATLSSVDTAEITDDAVTLAKIADAVVVTEAEGISSNDNDTTLPTSAAVKDYVDNNVSGALQEGSVVDLTNGGANNLTTVSLASGLSGVDFVDIMFDSMSTNSNDSYRIQLSTSSTFATTGYLSGSSSGSGGESDITNGLAIRNTGAVQVVGGIMRLSRIPGTNVWTAMHGANEFAGGGSVTLAGELDGIRITTDGGTSTFDGGTIAVRYGS